MGNRELLTLIKDWIEKNTRLYFDDIKNIEHNINYDRCYYNCSFENNNYYFKIVIEHLSSIWLEIIDKNNKYSSGYESYISDILWKMNITEKEKYITENLIKHIIYEFLIVFKNNDFIWTTSTPQYEYYVYKNIKYLCSDFNEYMDSKSKLAKEIQNKTKKELNI